MSDIQWSIDPTSPWPSPQPVIDLALDALPVISDNLAAELIEQLVETIVDLRDELTAVRVVLSESLTFGAAQLGRAVNARRELAERKRSDRAAR